MEFPCQMLTLLFSEINEHEGAIWFLDVMTDITKKDFIDKLLRALKYLEENYGEHYSNYFVEYEVITFTTQDYFDGYVAAKKNNNQKLINDYGYKKLYKFIQVASNEMLPIQNMLNDSEAYPTSWKKIVKLIKKNEDVFYKNFTND